jgi:hypothetical protein
MASTMTAIRSTHTAGLTFAEHNAAAPLCCLPHETLVSIFKLVQRAHAPRIHNHSVSWGIADTKWRHMLFVCVHLRKTALHTPELWAVVDTRWHARWIELCVERARDCRLTVVSQVANDDEVEVTRKIFQQAGHVHIAMVHPFSTRSVFQARYAEILDVPLQLLSLDLAFSAIGNVPITLPVHRLGATLTSLDVQRVQLARIPHLPHLTHLGLNAFTPPPFIDWLDRWLVSTPQLNSLMLRRPSGRTCVSLSSPVTLPHLAHLDLQYIHRAEIVSLLQKLPSPSRSLSIRTACHLDAGEPASAVKAIHEHAVQFWSGAPGAPDMPPAQVRFVHAGGTDVNACELDIVGSAEPRELSVHVDVRRSATALGPFLPYVVGAKVRARTLHDVVWPELGLFPRLRWVKITTLAPQTAADADGLQAWASARERPVLIRIGQRGLPAGALLHGKWYLRVEWDPADGPVVDAWWRRMPGRILQQHAVASEDDDDLD